MTRRSVALLVETSNGYCRGLLDGVIAYVKEMADWSVFLTEQERGAAPPKWLKAWDGDGIIARIETDAIAQQLRNISIPIVDLADEADRLADRLDTDEGDELADLIDFVADRT